MEKITEFKNGIEKTYNVNFLKRLVCKVCGDCCYDTEDFFYNVTFDKEIEKVKKDVPEYADLTVENTWNYLCHGCLTELFVECPETIIKIQRKYP